MDGNARFELGSPSPDSGFTGNYINGPRGFLVPNLGRSSSFKEGADSRNFSSAKANSRSNASLSRDVPSLSQCLMLDPILTGDLKYGRTGHELKRILSFSVSSSVEENSFGAAHMKNSPPVAVDELRRLRVSVEDNCFKATGRVKKLDEHLSKLNKFFEGMPFKKQHRSELLAHERSSGSTLKTGSQIQRNPSEPGIPKHDDRPKNGVLNKRLRTSMADSRLDCRNLGAVRQPLMVGKDKDMLSDINADSEMIEEKIRRLPAGGEGWGDRKMKRKRSGGAASSRSIDNEAEIKRNVHPRKIVDTSMQSGESTPSFRSGASGGSNKLDPVFSPVASAARPNLKIDQERSLLSRDIPVGPIKERALGKVNVKLNNRDDYQGIYPSPIVKGKGSRTPRSGSVVAANSPANIPRPVGTLESWDQPQDVNKMSSIGGVNNQKRFVSVGSTSSPITQWVGQRPQKISRPRRTNLLPVSNNDEMQMQGEGYSPSDFSPRMSVGGLNAPCLPKSAICENQNFKIKAENVPSPVKFSESQESGAAENRVHEKSSGSRDGEERPGCSRGYDPSVPMKKNKTTMKEGNGDGVKRQGRNARASPFSRPSSSPTTDTIDNTGPNKPPRNARFSSEKNGSKSGRPVKKISDRKSYSRSGQMANGCSPDCSGETDDDHEELLTAAKLACNSTVNACSSAFWKTVEPLFTSIGPKEKLFISQQMKLAEESYPDLSQDHISDNTIQEQLDCYGHEEMTVSNSLSSKRNRCTKVDKESNEPLDGENFVTQLQNSSLHGFSDVEQRFNLVTPLYQRVLSALILDEEVQELEETGFGRSRSSINESCVIIDSGSRPLDRLDSCETVLGNNNQKSSYPNVICPCNGYINRDRSVAAHDRLCNGDLLHRDGGYVHSEVEMLVRVSRDDCPQSLQDNNGEISYYSQYAQMCLEEKLILELQSVGLFLEAVPALDDKEDELNEEMTQLESELHGQLASKKKTCLDKIQKSIRGGTEERNPEQVAMDNLVELAYKKLLATKASYASEHDLPKVPKQVAASFAKRTLVRCRKFEETVVSCFSEPSLREIVYASPPQFTETELLSGVNLAIGNDGSSADALKTSDQVARNGPPYNRSKKKEVLLDDVCGGSSGFRALGSSGGAKGKRSERDRDGSGRNSLPKSGRLSLGSTKGERKTKSKPKQKTAQLSTPENNKLNDGTSFSNPSASELANNNGTKRKDVRFISSSGNDAAAKDSMDFKSLNVIDGIVDLGIDENGAPQDFSSWLNNIDVDGLQEDGSIGLEIPMDDLSELNMF